MIKVKDMEVFKETAKKLIAYLDEGKNFYSIKKKEPNLIKWYYSYMPITYSLEKEARDLLHEIYIKRHNLSRAETAKRISQTKKNPKKLAEEKSEEGLINSELSSIN